MAVWFLNRADIVATFQKVSGEAMTKYVSGSMFGNARSSVSTIYRFLNDRLMDVVATLHVGFPIKILATCRKHELPSPSESALGYFRAIAPGNIACPASSRKSFS